jgi:hypothetical protein
MDKALIEKAFEQFMEKELGFIHNPQDSFYRLHKKLWLECATWQREQLIKELREWAMEDAEMRTDEFPEESILTITLPDLLAKLDELEGEGYE